MSGTLVADLGVGPEVWLFLTLLGCLTIFFKFSRIWSVRNLDLLLLFAPAPGMMRLVGHQASQPWIAFLWLFFGSALWLTRCLIDLGLARRPLLEPNLNAAGLACLSIGVLGLLVAETVSLPVDEGVARNPADPGGARPQSPPSGTLVASSAEAAAEVLKPALPSTLTHNPAQVILSRVLASLGHLGLVFGLIAVGWWHFERPIAGLAVATCYLLLPYTRIALVDSGQLVPAALIVAAIAFYTRPAVAGALIGMAAGWMPACLGLVAALGRVLPGPRPVAVRGGRARPGPDGSGARRGRPRRWRSGRRRWVRGACAEAGLLPQVEAPSEGSFWSGIDVSYRLPVLIVYLALVVVTSIWPAREEPGRADRAVGRAARRQPVLVPRQGRDARFALPPAGPPDDVPAHPDGEAAPARARHATG